jgi:hypothetical protein
MFQRSNPWTSLPDLLTGSAHDGADYDNGGGGDDDDDYYYYYVYYYYCTTIWCWMVI